MSEKYRGDPTLCHIPDGERASLGIMTAEIGMMLIRERAGCYGKPICPGCYMVMLVNAAIHGARLTGQSMREMALSMSDAFALLAEHPDIGMREEIEVVLDPEEDSK